MSFLQGDDVQAKCGQLSKCSPHRQKKEDPEQRAEQSGVEVSRNAREIETGSWQGSQRLNHKGFAVPG